MAFRCLFGDSKYDRWLSRIEFKLDRTLTLVQEMTLNVTQEGNKLMTIQDDVAAMVTAVAQNTTVTGSVSTLLTQLTALLASLKGQVVDPATVAALEGAITTLTANNAAIADAVVTNTPSA